MSERTISPSADRSAELALLVERLSARLEAGEPVDVDEIAHEHPAYAAELRELLPAVALMVNLSRSCERRGVSPTCDDTGAPLGELGDFRIVREVGRGGMGIVYEAEQISLGRHVALKVLPYAATMDAKQLQRFKNEAKAAASLHHEHIVPIHAVGCERGVHYYAMQFIDGSTLAQLIAGRAGSRERPVGPQAPETCEYRGGLTPPRSPDAPTAPVAALSTEPGGPNGRAFYRAAAQLIAQAADALEHAHSLGIVHRDVKPANLLVDTAGKLYVSDFGLARFGPDAGLTLSGDLVGTLRYMAPEQALARHGVVNHRADVYALGATLYELLTGRPAVDATERAEVLRQIAFGEPAAPRKSDKAIPAELETISLKCLAKDPDERYATAGELAEDLRRWLEDQPISAKPPGLGQRVRRWGWRHGAFVWAGVAVLLVGFLLASVCAFLLWKERQATLAAWSQEARQRAIAEDREGHVRRHSYAGDIYQAYLLRDRNDPLGARQLLARHVPEPDREDLRGFEWYHLDRAWKAHDGAVLSHDHRHVHAVAFSPDSAVLATAGGDGTVIVWDVPSRAPKFRLTGPKADVNGVAFSPDGVLIATASDDGTVKVWEAASGKKVWERPDHGDMVVGVAFSADGTLLASGGRKSGVILWDPTTGERRSRLPAPPDAGELQGLAFTPDSRSVVTAVSRAAHVWDVCPNNAFVWR
jgi:serine/threonine protein kinase